MEAHETSREYLKTRIREQFNDSELIKNTFDVIDQQFDDLGQVITEKDDTYTNNLRQIESDHLDAISHLEKKHDDLIRQQKWEHGESNRQRKQEHDESNRQQKWEHDEAWQRQEQINADMKQSFAEERQRTMARIKSAENKHQMDQLIVSVPIKN